MIFLELDGFAKMARPSFFCGAVLALILAGCGADSSDEAVRQPAHPALYALYVTSEEAMQGAEVTIYRTDASDIILSDIGLDASKAGLGSSAVVLARPMLNFSGVRLGITVAIYSREGGGNKSIRVLTIDAKYLTKVDVYSFRCADGYGNPVSCAVHWDSTDA